MSLGKTYHEGGSVPHPALWSFLSVSFMEIGLGREAYTPEP